MLRLALGFLGALLFSAALMAFVADDPPQREDSEEANPGDDDSRTRTTKQGRDRLDYVAFVLSLITLVALLFYTAINYELYRTTQIQFAAARRAYIVFGSPNGKLAEFGPKIDTASNKHMIKLYFYNAGETTARHFVIRAYANTGIEPPPWTHRHRWSGPTIGISTTGMGDAVDLGAKAAHIQYLTDPKFLWAGDQLKTPNFPFYVMGEYEYCDVFGGYHCESFAAEYKPPPIDDFVGSAMHLPCIVERDINTAYYQTQGAVEIQPCEQPSEAQYMNETDFPLRPTHTPSATPTR